MPYSAEYRHALRSPRWRKLKWRRLVACGFKCEDCGEECPDKRPKKALDWFDLHHDEGYARLGRERIGEVRVLCRTCHTKPGRHPWKDT